MTEEEERPGEGDDLRELLFAAIPKIGPQPRDACATALDSARVSH